MVLMCMVVAVEVNSKGCSEKWLEHLVKVKLGYGQLFIINALKPPSLSIIQSHTQ